MLWFTLQDKDLFLDSQKRCPKPTSRRTLKQSRPRPCSDMLKIKWAISVRTKLVSCQWSNFNQS
uniref:Uncharacterized protein n=1 Tax=Rhizophora mucronata TaxID=61149 RepID=A0A2P2J4U1_RHIMU